MTLEAPPQGVTSASGRSIFFDLMRGLASQMVVVGHALNVFLPAYFMEQAASGRLEARGGLFYAQNLGVLLFFYISGFLITASAQRKVSSGLGFLDFAADRVARIFTPLIPMLLLVFALDHAVFANAAATSRYSDINASIGDLLLNATMLAGNPALATVAERTGLTWLSSASFGSADQLWTVIVEWWIYIVFGFGFFVVAARQRSSLAGWVLCGALLAIALPLMIGTALNTPGLIIAWVAGMLVRLLRPPLERIPRFALLGFAIIALAGAAVRLSITEQDLYDPLTAALLAVTFFGTLLAIDSFSAVANRPSLMRVVQFMSNISYSLYLVHFSLLIWSVHLFPELVGHPSGVVLLFAVCNLAAWLFFLGFERHYPRVRVQLQTLLDRLPRARVEQAQA